MLVFAARFSVKMEGDSQQWRHGYCHAAQEQGHAFRAVQADGQTPTSQEHQVERRWDNFNKDGLTGVHEQHAAV
jgi:hypothetical protein